MTPRWEAQGPAEGRGATRRVTDRRARRCCHTLPVPSDGAPIRSRFPVPTLGDQPEAIAALVNGAERGDRYQTLLGITGSGKTATIAWTIEALQRPTLIIEPNKSLAAQLASELKDFFPHNRVEYFVSYYDYYQPEAYVPSSDTYIEKDSSINDEIDRLRHATTSSLLLRRDTIVVASVSCIYGLGSPDDLPGPDHRAPARRGPRAAHPPATAGGAGLHPQRHDPEPGPVPGPRATRSRSMPPMRSRRSGSSSSGTRWSGSAPST